MTAFLDRYDLDGVSLADDLIAERRREAAREDQESVPGWCGREGVRGGAANVPRHGSPDEKDD